MIHHPVPEPKPHRNPSEWAEAQLLGSGSVALPGLAGNPVAVAAAAAAAAAQYHSKKGHTSQKNPATTCCHLDSTTGWHLAIVDSQ